MGTAHGRVFAAASRFAFDAPAEHKGGLFRLAAGAAHWERLRHGLPDDLQARAVAVDPADSNVVWCGGDAGPCRSDDGGDTWKLVDLPGPTTVWTIQFDPTDPATMYVGTGPAALFRSTDRGATFELLEQAKIRARLDMGFPTRLVSVAVDPLHGEDIWAGVEVGGLLRTDDGGATWHDVTDGLEALAEQERFRSRLFSDTEAEGMLDIHRLARSAAAPGAVFVGLRMGVFRTDDNGASYRSLEVGRFSPLTYCRDLRVSPHDPRVLYATLSDEALGKQGTVWRSDDLGESWRQLGDLRSESTMMQLTPSANGELWCATRRGDVWASADDGVTWQAYPLPEGGRDIYSVAS